MKLAVIKLLKGLSLGAWALMNIASIIVTLFLKPNHRAWMVILMVVAVTPLYVCFTHWLDENFQWFGLRSLRKQLRSESTNEFRKILRLEMLVITSGFAATLFFLSIQLYFDLGEQERPTLVIWTMSFLFFLASLLNLLQIILYDFQLVAKDEKRPEFKILGRRLATRLNLFREISWHALVAPVILAFSLFDYTFCLIVNFLYGTVLFLYYFLPGRDETSSVYDQT